MQLLLLGRFRWDEFRILVPDTSPGYVFHGHLERHEFGFGGGVGCRVVLDGFHDDGGAAIEIGKYGEARVTFGVPVRVEARVNVCVYAQRAVALKARHLDVVPLRYSIIFVSRS